MRLMHSQTKRGLYWAIFVDILTEINTELELNICKQWKLKKELTEEGKIQSGDYLKK